MISLNYFTAEKETDISASKAHFENIKTKFLNDKNYSFFNITNDNKLLNECKQVYEKFKSKKVFVQIGIGGSHLGPEMLFQTFSANSNRRFIFINNIDSEEIFNQLKNLTPDDCLFYVVSKSGTTAETLAALTIVIKWGKFNSNELKNHIVFCTDPVVGDLRKFSKDYEISTLDVPPEVGGRFSILTPVGILPAIFCGANVEEIFEGAQLLKKEILEDKTENNLLLKAGHFIFDQYTKNKNETVIMPYSSKMKYFSFWFTQLWAESLGKKRNLKDEKVYSGLTPIPAYGATDQHSQIQLFMEGPLNKVMIFIDVAKRKNDYDLSNDFTYESLKKFKGLTLNELLKAEFQGTLKAFSEAKRPYLHLTIDECNEQFIGQLILFFECLTAFVGQLMQVNPFDQPGVEAGKRYAWEWIAEKK